MKSWILIEVLAFKSMVGIYGVDHICGFNYELYVSRIVRNS